MSPTSHNDELYQAAVQILAKEGPRALTMNRLARASGRSRATVYRQTGGREALLDALAARGAEVGDRTDPRTRILAAAREVFGRVGFDAASIEEIAAVARVGVATVYRHFDDKDGLVTAFLDQLEPRRAAREARASISEDVRSDLENLAERMLAGMRDDAPLVRLLILETLCASPLLERVRAKAPTRVVAMVAAILREHAAAGRLRNIDPKLLAQSFGGMVLAFGVIAPILRGEPAADPAETAHAITDLFLRGALPDRGEAVNG